MRSRRTTLLPALLVVLGCGRTSLWELDWPGTQPERTSGSPKPCDVTSGVWTVEPVQEGNFDRVAVTTVNSGALHLTYVGAGLGAAQGLWHATNTDGMFTSEFVTSNARPDDTAIAADERGDVHLAWFGYRQDTSALAVFYGSRALDGQWRADMINPIGQLWSLIRYSHVSLTTTSDDRHHLLFRVVSNVLGHAHGQPGDWDYGSRELFTGTTGISSVADQEGQFHIAYYEQIYHYSDRGQIVELEPSLRLYEGDESTKIDTVRIPFNEGGATPDSVPNCSSSVSLGLGDDGVLHAAYTFAVNESGVFTCGLRYAVRRNGNWSHLTLLVLDGISSPSLALDRTGAVHIAYALPEQGIGYATNRLGPFRLESVPGVGDDPQIAVGPKLTAHVVYVDKASPAVRVASRTPDQACE
jgi:hypothetical protein